MASLIGHHLLFCTVFLCAAILFLNPISCSADESKLQTEHKLLFVFGDSHFDPGNNQYLKGSGYVTANHWPYGINNHNHSTGRFSDGLVVPDFIALSAKLNLLPPFLQPGASFTDGANFASGGAGVLESYPTHSVINLRTQLNDFKTMVDSMIQKVGETKTKKILMQSVLLFSIGINDYARFNTKYPNATELERRQYTSMVIGNLTSGLKELYELGVRKIAFQNVGPLGCYPAIKQIFPKLVNGGCIAKFSAHANQHNRILAYKLIKLERELPGFKYAIFDYYHAIGDRIANPTKYGFKFGGVACCGSGLYNAEGCAGGDNGTLPFKLCSDPNDYVTFDGRHHTQKTNQQLAQLMWNGTNLTGPHTVQQFFEL